MEFNLHSMKFEFTPPTHLQYGDCIEIRGKVGKESFTMELQSDHMAFDPHIRNIENHYFTEDDDANDNDNNESIDDGDDDDDNGDENYGNDLPIVQTQPLRIVIETDGSWDINASSPETSISSHGSSSRRYGFKIEENFVCRVIIKTDQFNIYLNNLLLASSEHLVPVNSIYCMIIDGDSIIDDVLFGTPNAVEKYNQQFQLNKGVKSETVFVECRLNTDDELSTIYHNLRNNEIGLQCYDKLTTPHLQYHLTEKDVNLYSTMSVKLESLTAANELILSTNHAEDLIDDALSSSRTSGDTLIAFNQDDMNCLAKLNRASSYQIVFDFDIYDHEQGDQFVHEQESDKIYLANKQIKSKSIQNLAYEYPIVNKCNGNGRLLLDAYSKVYKPHTLISEGEQLQRETLDTWSHFQSVLASNDANEMRSLNGLAQKEDAYFNGKLADENDPPTGKQLNFENPTTTIQFGRKLLYVNGEEIDGAIQNQLPEQLPESYGDGNISSGYLSMGSINNTEIEPDITIPNANDDDDDDPAAAGGGDDDDDDDDTPVNPTCSDRTKSFKMKSRIPRPLNYSHSENIRSNFIKPHQNSTMSIHTDGNNCASLHNCIGNLTIPQCTGVPINLSKITAAHENKLDTEKLVNKSITQTRRNSMNTHHRKEQMNSVSELTTKSSTINRRRSIKGKKQGVKLNQHPKLCTAISDVYCRSKTNSCDKINKKPKDVDHSICSKMCDMEGEVLAYAMTIPDNSNKVNNVKSCWMSCHNGTVTDPMVTNALKRPNSQLFSAPNPSDEPSSDNSNLVVKSVEHLPQIRSCRMPRTVDNHRLNNKSSSINNQRNKPTSHVMGGRLNSTLNNRTTKQLSESQTSIKSCKNNRKLRVQTVNQERRQDLNTLQQKELDRLCDGEESNQVTTSLIIDSGAPMTESLYPMDGHMKKYSENCKSFLHSPRKWLLPKNPMNSNKQIIKLFDN